MECIHCDPGFVLWFYRAYMVHYVCCYQTHVVSFNFILTMEFTGVNFVPQNMKLKVFYLDIHQVTLFIILFLFWYCSSCMLKVEAVTKRILWIKSTTPEAKVLVFSSWNDVLDVLQHAFTANNITFIRMQGGR